MSDKWRVFLLRVDVIETASGKMADDDIQAKLVRRRLKRIERTLVPHAGTLVHSLPNGLLASFTTAEDAVHGACDMQQCCAAIPQIPGTRVGIRIGIDAGPADQGNASTASSASRLAMLGSINAIVMSNAVADELAPALRLKASPLSETEADMPALSFDWKNVTLPARQAPPDAAKAQKTVPQPSNRIVLRKDGKILPFLNSRRVITIGRDITNDIEVGNPEASRKHCRIVIQNDSYVLVDQSTNGTWISPDSGAPLHVRHKMVTLSGAGWIAFGHPHGRGSDSIVEFHIREDAS